MAKQVLTKIKLNIPAGKATPAPPIGPALGQHGVAIMDFCKQFNAKTGALGDTIVPVVITVYEDRSFDFITKTPPTSELIKKFASIEKGSSAASREKVGKITKQQVEEIAKTKMPDLNTQDIKQAAKIVEGTAKQMGVEIEDTDNPTLT